MISTEIRHAEEDVEDFEKNRKSIMMQIDSTGFFAFGKKKELKSMRDKLNQDIYIAKEKINELVQKKTCIENSKDAKVLGLPQLIEKLKLDIETGEGELSEKKIKLNKFQDELKNIEEKIL